MAEIITCTPKRLPEEMLVPAAEHAIDVNRANRPPVERIMRALPGVSLDRASIAVLTAKRWKTDGVRLTVSFMEPRPGDLRARIVSHMNAWGKTANIKFTQTDGQAQVRIAFEADGYWSYLGTDVLLIEPHRQTMNLEGFTMQTPDSEFHRVVRHEAGHTLGFPHEHMRKDLVDLIDREKAIAYFMASQGWTREQVIAQVLTPIRESSLLGTTRVDGDSIMCYQIPGQLTKSGKPIPGGLDIDELDAQFASICYPKPKRASATAAKASKATRLIA